MTEHRKLTGPLVAAILLSCTAALPAATEGKVIEEIWEEVRLEDGKVGHVHTLVQEIAAPSGKRLRTTVVLDLTLRRYGSTVRLRTTEGTEETLEGRVVGVFLRQGQEGSRQLDLHGELDDGRMHVVVDGGRLDQRMSWPEGIVGWHGRNHLFEKRRPAIGDRFAFLRYESLFNAVTRVQVSVRGLEEVRLPEGGAKQLLRVEMVPDPLEAPGIKVTPPVCTWWLDRNFVPVRRTIELEGLGAVVLTRTTRERAEAPVPPSAAVDIGTRTLIPVDRRIPRPYDTRQAVYRITLRGDVGPEAPFTDDAHQEVRRLDREHFELRVHPPVPQPRSDPGPPPADCLSSCHYIDCDMEVVIALAARAVGDETFPWKKARRIERWVKQQMKADNTAPLVSAAAAARDLRGDCRHYALLTAALCRASGIPARTAIGLLYVERGGRPQMGFHMWTEVWIDGQWLGLDATLGRGGVDAAHLKITDHSWKDTQSLTPLLPVNRVLGKLGVEVLRAQEND
jgi:hypothetical protein